MRVVASRVVYENRWMRVHEDRFEGDGVGVDVGDDGDRGRLDVYVWGAPVTHVGTTERGELACRLGSGFS